MRRKDEDSRPIKAVYYNGTGDKAKALKKCAGVHAWSMMRNAYNHLQLQHFPKARHCEVYDNKVLHGTHTFQLKDGKWELHSYWKRNPRFGLKEGE